ncbi:hypothetical protein BGX34_003881 [Mortierella sp. NVP85]|nr:hypothetical protein BGX34_003881 [Mortierella sp. NVP85]
MKRSSKVILTVVALVALIGSTSVITTEAAPVANGASVQNWSTGYEAQDLARHLYKRQATEKPTGAKPEEPKPSAPPKETTAPKPNPNPNPANPSTPPKETAPAKETSAAAKPPAKTQPATHATSPAARGGSSVAARPTGSNVPPSSSGAPTAPGGGDVPTGVSQTVLIGLGTVGGLIVFALGGLAFCRHRKKKNLASALLLQTAQFNNNNPYAKLPDPPATKETIPEAPAKPIGTYTVVTTYIPNLSDEIEMVTGDSATIAQEFDDGWCKGVNNSKGTEGFFPRHCVAMGPYEGSQDGAPGGAHFAPPSPNFKAAANKRVSSIAPGGWNDFKYPPEPSPQYPAAYQGGNGGYYH